MAGDAVLERGADGLQRAVTAKLPHSFAELNKRRLRFGLFELRTDTHELSRLGTRVRLQTKPARILEALVSRPGELVRREELREWLWPGNVFVDFESGLNTAVNRLRAVLGDMAETPVYVETIPRQGYRFVCPVQDMSLELPACQPPDYVIPSEEAASARFEPPARELTRSMFLRLVVAVLLAWTFQFLFFNWNQPQIAAAVKLIAGLPDRVIGHSEREGRVRF